MLIFLGALIVFFTFIVKDGFREYVKDRMDSLELAKSTYLIRSDTASMNELLPRVDRAISSLRDLIISKGHILDEKSFDAIWDNATRFWLEEDRVKPILFNVSRLLDTFPNATDEKELSRLNGILDEVTKGNREIVALITPTQNVLPKAKKERQKAIEDRTAQAVEKEGALAIKASELDEATNKLATQVFTDAEVQSKIDKSRYEFYTRLSYCLYVFGWGLALAGRLKGTSGTDADE